MKRSMSISSIRESELNILSANQHHDYLTIKSDIIPLLITKPTVFTVKWYTQLYFLGPLILIISLFVGIAFYVFYNGWSLSSATFCASATLMGSIFGVPDQPSDFAAAFTIIYYIYGISLVSSILGAVVGAMIIRAPEMAAEARRKLAINEPEDIDGDGEIGWCDLLSFWRVKFLHFIYWEEYYKNYIITFTAMLWIGLGVVYGLLYENWTFNHSLYFAINVVSMAALPNPPCIGESPSNCEIGTFRGFVLSAYVLIGVPIFTFAVAQFAGIMVVRAVRDHELKIIHQPLTQDEYNYAANLYGNDEVLSLGEFTVLELLRLQRVSKEDLEHIKILFCAIDEAETGIVDQPMLAKNNLICSSTDWPTKPTLQVIDEHDPTIINRNRGNSNASSVISSKRRKLSRSVIKPLCTPRNARSRSPSSSALKRNPSSSVVVSKLPEYNELEGLLEKTNRMTENLSTSSSEGGGGDGSEGGSNISNLDIPVSIRRMSMREYNKLVVPLALKTTLLGITDVEFKKDTCDDEYVEDLDESCNNSAVNRV